MQANAEEKPSKGDKSPLELEHSNLDLCWVKIPLGCPSKKREEILVTLTDTWALSHPFASRQGSPSALTQKSRLVLPPTSLQNHNTGCSELLSTYLEQICHLICIYIPFNFHFEQEKTTLRAN